MHPLAKPLTKLKDNEIEDKIQDLSRKYFMTQNPAVKAQIVSLLDMYKEEIAVRRAAALQQQYKKRDTDLDSLIDIS